MPPAADILPSAPGRLLPALTSTQKDIARWFPHPLMWAMLPAFALLAAAWLPLAGMELAYTPALHNLAVALGVMTGMALLAQATGAARVAVFLFSLSFFLAFGVLGRVLNYLAMSTGLPFVDEWLARADALLGFDWLTFVAWMNGQERLTALAGWAYGMHGWLFFTAFAWLAATGRFTRLRGLLMLFAFCGLLTMTIGALLPALGGFGHFRPAPEVIGNLPPDAGRSFLDHLVAVNAGELKRIVLEEADGLVAFPSYHTIMALMFIWAMRGTWLQWPVWGIAGLMLFATPVFGGHYLVDILAGGAVFALVLMALRRAGLLDEDVERQDRTPTATTHRNAERQPA